MTVHIDHAHHHPVVRRTGPRARPWEVRCDCGHIHHEAMWRGAWVDALIHSEALR